MRQTKTAAQLLHEAVENALIAGDPSLQIETQAKRLITEEKELIEANTPEWQFREVVRLFRLKRRELAKKQRAEDQFLLPGFERVPQRIVIRDGKKKPLDKATYRQLRDYYRLLWNRGTKSLKLAQVKALMDLVQPYATETPGITVREVCEREAAK